ncbi:hypothetical protein CRENBAI_004981 [Crenichthys baileyi]|uniref:C2H2-type domain-containing protein n=1 Tax=Crenichthys baileyi TaxID=28760 RepID=A0AAV9R7Q0_9TELE
MKENHELKIEVEEENHKLKIEVEEENHKLKIEVKEENHEIKIEVKEEDEKIKVEQYQDGYQDRKPNHHTLNTTNWTEPLASGPTDLQEHEEHQQTDGAPTVSSKGAVHGQTGKKPYSCDQCGATLKTKTDLKRHQRIHTGERPYSCDQCEAAFNTSNHLQRHKRIHTDGHTLENGLTGVNCVVNSFL